MYLSTDRGGLVNFASGFPFISRCTFHLFPDALFIFFPMLFSKIPDNYLDVL
jgi:hypothetical protein